VGNGRADFACGAGADYKSAARQVSLKTSDEAPT